MVFSSVDALAIECKLKKNAIYWFLSKARRSLARALFDFMMLKSRLLLIKEIIINFEIYAKFNYHFEKQRFISNFMRNDITLPTVGIG